MNILKSGTKLITKSFHSSAINYFKKDPYQVLGVGKQASQNEIKKKYYQVILFNTSSQRNIILIPTRIRKPKRNSLKFNPPMKYFLTNKRDRTMTNLDTKMDKILSKGIRSKEVIRSDLAVVTLSMIYFQVSEDLEGKWIISGKILCRE